MQYEVYVFLVFKVVMQLRSEVKIKKPKQKKLPRMKQEVVSKEPKLPPPETAAEMEAKDKKSI